MVQKILLVLLLAAPLGFFPFLRHTPTAPRTEDDEPPTKPYKISADERLALHCFAGFPGQPFPGNLPWEPLRIIGEDEANTTRRNAGLRLLAGLSNQSFPASVPWEPLAKLTSDPTYAAYLARNEPVRFLENCLGRYEGNVKGYRCMFLKQEKVKGNLREAEQIIVHFREKPFSVHMNWKEGATDCVRSMYVEGQNKGNLVARGLLFGRELPILVRLAVDAPQAKATSRFPITDFGMYLGAKKTLDSMRDASARGKLHVRFEGLETVKKLGNRPCYKLERYLYDPEEDDGIKSMTIYIDQETLFQTGSILRDASKQLIAEYYFRDIELNPAFDAKQFTDAKM